MTLQYEAIKCEHGHQQSVKDHLMVEEALQININQEPFTVIMQSPGDELDLARGLLYAEDIAIKDNDKYDFQLGERNELGHITTVNVQANETDLGTGYKNSRSLLSVSSCGICGKRELGDLAVSGEKISTQTKITLVKLQHMFAKMQEQQGVFALTGGSHAAALFTESEELLALKEDVGRHNAVDKVIGSTLLNNSLSKAHYLLVSGRVSYEIVTKAFVAKTPILAAVSAPSSLAVDYAKELGITLFGFCRDGRATCYANPARLYTE
ncbi:MAG: formate dehydrogenase family accessory protein FdhD [Crocinitomicaceae bacterium]|nr:formate dehydrogenase family accessory protein FdhD [Crocinitomicaceae bacterium]